MSQTPETDELAEWLGDERTYAEKVSADFARKLERERNAAKRSAKDSTRNFRASEVKRIEAERERDAALADWKTKRDALIHKRFFFQPHPDDATKCNCAYCARDFEAIAEYAVLMEMEIRSLEEERNQLRSVSFELANQLAYLSRAEDWSSSTAKKNDEVLKKYLNLPHVKEKEKQS